MLRDFNAELSSLVNKCSMDLLKHCQTFAMEPGIEGVLRSWYA